MSTRHPNWDVQQAVGAIGLLLRRENWTGLPWKSSAHDGNWSYWRRWAEVNFPGCARSEKKRRPRTHPWGLQHVRAGLKKKRTQKRLRRSCPWITHYSLGSYSQGKSVLGNVARRPQVRWGQKGVLGFRTMEVTSDLGLQQGRLSFSPWWQQQMVSITMISL